MDPTALTIVVISFILTALLVFLGVQVWHILKEFRLSIQKVNKMLDDAGRVTETVGDTAEGMSGLVSGLKAGLSLISSFRRRREDDEGN